MKLTELVCSRLRSRCNAELIVQQAEGTTYMTDERKRVIFRRVLSDLENSVEKKKIEQTFREERPYCSVIAKNLMFLKPVYQIEGNSVYYFVTLSKNFSQFVYDVACELLETEELFTRSHEFVLHSYEMMFCITDGDKSLIFDYEFEKASGKMKGIVIVDE